MRNVIPQFLRILLAVPPLLGHQVALGPEGGGGLRLDGRSLTFHPSEAVPGPPVPGLRDRPIRLKGLLRAASGEALTFEILFTRDGGLLRLDLFRKSGRVEVERWAATVKTRLTVTAWEPRAGGTVRIRLEGPLSGVVRGKARATEAHGEIWSTLQSGPRG